ncbi:MAG: tetratricopeptide repeat protein [Chloroflexi bacterium]|nr:tetratricopeptide repeat protein [Chloroflexota bacterium]
MESQLVNGRYMLHDELGAGGMGTVYRATDRLTGRAIAIKRLIPTDEWLDMMSASTSESMLFSLAREFEALASLRHPNIISVLDYGFDQQKNPFLVMELLHDARTVIDYGAGTSIMTKASLLIEMLQALTYLHRRGVIHRDLKPDNVLVVDGTIKLLDFGLAVKGGQQTRLEGTLAYTAPELLKGQPVSPASDLYAVGIIAYELFSGQMPFEMIELESFLLQVTSTPPDLDQLDAPPAIAAIVGQMLAKSPHERPNSALDVIHALAEASGIALEETSSIRESFLQAATFVGRDGEIAQLTGALEQAQAGHGSLWLIGGESGVGKSRLLDELRTRALIEGVRVLHGQGVANGGMPYQIWRNILRHLVLTTQVSDTEAGILREIVPDIDALIERDTPPVPELEGLAGQQRLQFTIVDLVKRQTQPLLLLLEDLHWAAESLEPLKLAFNQIAGQPVLIVGTYRDDENPDLPQEIGDVNRLKLERLTTEAIETLSTSMLGEGGAREGVISLLQRETEGNVFFLVEVVRALAEAAGGLEDISHMTLPRGVFAGGVQEVVRRRLDKVPAPFQPLLKTAAVAGRQLDLDVLVRLANSVSLTEFLTACQNAAVLEVREDQWRFSHDKLRESLLVDMLPDERSALHRQVAEATQATYPGADEYAGVLADHFQVAGDTEQEIHYGQIAAKQAIDLSDFTAGLRRVERILALLPDTAHDARQYNSFLAAKCHQELSNYEDATRLYAESLGLAQEAENTIGEAEIHLGQGEVAFRQGNYSLAMSTTNLGLAMFRALGHQGGIARSLLHLASAHIRLNQYTEAKQYLQESLEIARATNDQAHTILARLNLGVLAAEVFDYETALVHYREAQTLAMELGDRFFLARILVNSGRAAMTFGNFEEALSSLTQARDLLGAIGNRYGVAVTLINLGHLSVILEDYDASRAYLDEALRISREIGGQYVEAVVLSQLGDVCAAQDELSTAEEHYRNALAIRRSIDDMRGIANCLKKLGALYLDQNQPKAARQYLAEALQTVQSLDASVVLLDILGECARLCWQREQMVLAAQIMGYIDQNAPDNAELEQALEKNRKTVAAAVEAFPADFAKGQTMKQDALLNFLLEQVLVD